MPPPLAMSLPMMLFILATIAFLVAERVFPGRKLPASKGWYARAVLVNLAQLIITLATAKLWIDLLGDASLFNFSGWDAPFLEGLAAWFAGTFFFYWWHRLRHAKGWWLVFHQIHHSPARIELATSFYKHPVEILSDALLSAVVLYPLLGCSFTGGVWYNFLAGVGEYLYHANIRMPAWLRYFIQTPELHSIHHQFDVHKYNFSDIPLWDRMFGTYKDTVRFVDRCGFPAGAEEKLIPMLAFQDVYFEDAT